MCAAVSTTPQRAVVRGLRSVTAVPTPGTSSISRPDSDATVSYDQPTPVYQQLQDRPSPSVSYANQKMTVSVCTDLT